MKDSRMQSFSPRICAVCPGFSALMRNTLPSLAAGRHPASCGQKQFIAVPLPDCHPERSRGTCCSPAAAQTFPPQQSVVLSSRAASTFSIVIPSAAEGPAVRRQRPGHFHRDRLPVLSSRAQPRDLWFAGSGRNLATAKLFPGTSGGSACILQHDAGPQIPRLRSG